MSTISSSIGFGVDLAAIERQQSALSALLVAGRSVEVAHTALLAAEEQLRTAAEEARRAGVDVWRLMPSYVSPAIAALPAPVMDSVPTPAPEVDIKEAEEEAAAADTEEAAAEEVQELAETSPAAESPAPPVSAPDPTPAPPPDRTETAAVSQMARVTPEVAGGPRKCPGIDGTGCPMVAEVGPHSQLGLCRSCGRRKVLAEKQQAHAKNGIARLEEHDSQEGQGEGAEATHADLPSPLTASPSLNERTPTDQTDHPHRPEALELAPVPVPAPKPAPTQGDIPGNPRPRQERVGSDFQGAVDTIADYAEEDGLIALPAMSVFQRADVVRWLMDATPIPQMSALPERIQMWVRAAIASGIRSRQRTQEGYIKLIATDATLMCIEADGLDAALTDGEVLVCICVLVDDLWHLLGEDGQLVAGRDPIGRTQFK